MLLSVTKALAVGAVCFVTVGPPRLTVSTATPAQQADGVALVGRVDDHGHDVISSLTGRRESLVNGVRTSTPLVIVRKSGDFTVTKQWPAGQPVLLVLTAERGAGGTQGVAEAIVKINAAGAIASVEYPRPGFEAGGEPRRTNATELEKALRSMAREQ